MNFVYVISERALGDANTKKAVKVGISREPNGRLKQLQTGNSTRLVLEKAIPLPAWCDAKILEKLVHAFLVDSRIAGEWFYCTPYRAIRTVETLLT